MNRPFARILAAAALAHALATVPALAQSPYGQYDRYHDHLWNPSNGGFAAGVANVPGVSPGGAAGSSYSQVVTYPGVGEDFHRRSENGISFAASYDGWQRTVEWLLARVASRLTPLAQAWRDREAAATG